MPDGNLLAAGFGSFLAGFVLAAVVATLFRSTS